MGIPEDRGGCDEGGVDGLTTDSEGGDGSASIRRAGDIGGDAMAFAVESGGRKVVNLRETESGTGRKKDSAGRLWKEKEGGQDTGGGCGEAARGGDGNGSSGGDGIAGWECNGMTERVSWIDGRNGKAGRDDERW